LPQVVVLGDDAVYYDLDNDVCILVEDEYAATAANYVATAAARGASFNGSFSGGGGGGGFYSGGGGGGGFDGSRSKSISELYDVAPPIFDLKSSGVRDERTRSAGEFTLNECFIFTIKTYLLYFTIKRSFIKFLRKVNYQKL